MQCPRAYCRYEVPVISAAPRNQDEDDREIWSRSQSVGRHRAAFLPGQPLRCPGTKVLGIGKRVCGQLLGSRVKHNSRVVVRVIRPGLPLIEAGGLEFDTPCPNCGARLEQYVTPQLPMDRTG